MKKLFIYGVTALAMLTGCNDLLDKSPWIPSRILRHTGATPIIWIISAILFITTLPALATEPVEDGSTSKQ